MSDLLGGLQDQTFTRATAATAVSYPPERRLSAEQLASFLDRRAFAVVGSARADGRPHAAMSLYIRRGTTFWLPTMAGSVRERNLRGTPWLTMVIAEGDHPAHIAVIAEGPAEVVAPQVPRMCVPRSRRLGHPGLPHGRAHAVLCRRKAVP
jgi:hypothetical protein